MTPRVTVVTVGATSKTLATLLSEASDVVQTGANEITMRPHETGIYMDDETATVNSDPLGVNPVTFSQNVSGLIALEFWASGDIKMSVIQDRRECF